VGGGDFVRSGRARLRHPNRKKLVHDLISTLCPRGHKVQCHGAVLCSDVPSNGTRRRVGWGGVGWGEEASSYDLLSRQHDISRSRNQRRLLLLIKQIVYENCTPLTFMLLVTNWSRKNRSYLFVQLNLLRDRLCGLVVRVPGY
jgi:hypothetical protein